MAWDRRCLLLTNHAMVLAVISSDPGVRIREIAQKVEITERAVESLIADLINVGFLSRSRSGRRNVYELHGEANLRHPLVADTTVDQLIGAITPEEPIAKPEETFGVELTPEETLSCIESSVAPIVSAEVHSTREGQTIKKVLVYMVVTSVLLCASVAVAATTRSHHHPRPTQPTHQSAPKSAANATPAVSHLRVTTPKSTAATAESTSSRPHTRTKTHTRKAETTSTPSRSTSTSATGGTGSTSTSQPPPFGGASTGSSGTTSVTVGPSGGTVKVGPTGTAVNVHTGDGGVSIGITPTGTSDPITIGLGHGLPVLGN